MQKFDLPPVASATPLHILNVFITVSQSMMGAGYGSAHIIRALIGCGVLLAIRSGGRQQAIERLQEAVDRLRNANDDQAGRAN
jgi:hypothetical protein